jgi:hypothetical protein
MLMQKCDQNLAYVLGETAIVFFLFFSDLALSVSWLLTVNVISKEIRIIIIRWCSQLRNGRTCQNTNESCLLQTVLRCIRCSVITILLILRQCIFFHYLYKKALRAV